MDIRRKRDFHEARWDEPIMELEAPESGACWCQRKADPWWQRPPELYTAGGFKEEESALNFRRCPRCRSLRHYMRLSQETMTSISTSVLAPVPCKAQPAVNERLVRSREREEPIPARMRVLSQDPGDHVPEAEYLKAISVWPKSASAFRRNPGHLRQRPSGLP